MSIKSAKEWFKIVPGRGGFQEGKESGRAPQWERSEVRLSGRKERRQIEREGWGKERQEVGRRLHQGKLTVVTSSVAGKEKGERLGSVSEERSLRELSTKGGGVTSKERDDGKTRRKAQE